MGSIKGLQVGIIRINIYHNGEVLRHNKCWEWRMDPRIDERCPSSNGSVIITAYIRQARSVCPLL